MSSFIQNLKGLFPWVTALDLIVFLLAFVIVLLVFALYVYRDSKLRGGKSLSWFIWTLVLGGLIPFIFYIMVRSPLTKDDIKEIEEKKEVIDLQKKYYELMLSKEISKCPVCGEEVKADYLFCPHCFTQLKKRCENCGHLVDKDSKICPYCGHIFDEKGENK
jgi:RNA polymerase subunit RPABC4/transcription elongation factor Spt4